jgi:hypothetical protein
MSKLTAADAPDGYWSRTELESLGLKLVFKDVSGKHANLGIALTHDERYMEGYIYREADYYVKNIRDAALFEMWEHDCKWKMNRAQYETEQEWITAYTEYANRADPDAVFQWAHQRISDDVPEYWEQIKDMCKYNDGAIRPDHPIIGCYHSARDENVELCDIRGWCPQCSEPLTQGDITIGGDLHCEPPLVSIEVFHCGNCGAVDPISGNDGEGFEAKWGRPFHLPLDPVKLGFKEEADGEEAGGDGAKAND